MRDLIRADPDALEAYAQVAGTATSGTRAALDTYRSSWSALLGATFVPTLSPPPSRAEAVGAALDELDALDVEVAGLARALRVLDLDGDGALSEADGIDEAYLNLFVLTAGAHPQATDLALVRETDRLHAVAATIVDVRRDGSDGSTRLVTLDLVDLDVISTISDADLVSILQAYDLVGADGPLHLMVHGWMGGSGGAGASTADRYDTNGVDGATVLAVNWDGKSLWDWRHGVIGEFRAAEESARATGDVLARVLSGVGAVNPGAGVAITAHSLGNHVATRAISRTSVITDEACLTDPLRIDYTAVQPAMPTDAYRDDPNYRALVDGRVDHLTLTTNNKDWPLFGYEVQGPEALGDEKPGSSAVRDIVARREAAGVTTDLVEHRSSDHAGHLTIDPGGSNLVGTLVDEQIDRMGGAITSPRTPARELIYEIGAERPDHPFVYVTGDSLFDSDAVQDHLAENPRPDLGEVEDVVRREIERLTDEANQYWVYSGATY